MDRIAIIDGGDIKLLILTEDMDAIAELAGLFNELANAEDEEKIEILKALEIWAYRHPKELNQIKSQVQWRCNNNA